MWLEPLSQVFVALMLLGQTTAAAPPPTESVTTRQTTFAIPFRVDQTEDAAKRPVELQLHVSTDRGAHWHLYAKAPPSQQHFMFRAGGDAEYWFAIRTVDRSGQAQPETIAGPGLRVLVDTTPPALKLTARHTQPGQVAVGWQIDEPHIKPDSLKIQYRTSSTDPWRPVTIERRAADQTAAPPSGQITFRSTPGTDTIDIRAEVSDTAGNPAVAQTQVKPDRDVGPQSAHAAKPIVDADRRPADDPQGSVAIAIAPAVGSNYGTDNDKPRTAPPTAGLPPGERPRMVNSRLFELQYDIDSVGPSGIGRVELWGTRDGGTTWRSVTLDNDRRSPLLVNVEDEGVYGFRVVVSNGAGLGGKPPQSGDLPDLWVGIDLTRPLARIISAQQGVDGEAGRLIISWQADDNRLAARPVSLSFSESRTGPWLPIASGLENTGRYAWPIDHRTPPRFYLRLEVRDEAGNVGVHEMVEPSTIDQSRPRIRIRDIRPVG